MPVMAGRYTPPDDDSDDHLSPREMRRGLRSLWQELQDLKATVATAIEIGSRIEVTDESITFKTKKD